ncbi:MAG TPA: hypothetical protein VGL89_10215 [Candidatus Koribacter sp.]|jgi:quercetin dioxygenase-like cupin family protein
MESWAQEEKPVAIEAESHHHLVIENEFVRVFHVTLPSGERTLYHVHLYDFAGVQLVTATTTDQQPGKPETAPKEDEVGRAWTMTESGPRTHRVHNVGSTTMDLMDVEFLKKASGTASEPIAQVVAENAEGRVYRWKMAAHETSATHAHTRPYLIVVVQPMRLKMTAPDGQSRTEDVKAGDLHWVDFAVTHSFTNESDAEGELVEIELK